MNALQTMEAVHIYVQTPQDPFDAAVGLDLGFLAMEDRVFQLDFLVLVQLDLLVQALDKLHLPVCQLESQDVA